MATACCNLVKKGGGGRHVARRYHNIYLQQIVVIFTGNKLNFCKLMKLGIFLLYNEAKEAVEFNSKSEKKYFVYTGIWCTCSILFCTVRLLCCLHKSKLHTLIDRLICRSAFQDKRFSENV